MSTIDLMLLGVLMQKPMNAYEIKKIMEYRNIKEWVKISSPSTYKNLLKLCKSGYLDGEVVREGEMPEKTIYTINDKGREYFMQLMLKYSETPDNTYIDFTAFIANLHCVDKDIGLKMIESLQINLATKYDILQREHKKHDGVVPFYVTEIISLYLQVASVFCNWAEEFKKKYDEHD